MTRFKVTTKLRKGIKDIQGDAISLNVNATTDWNIENMQVGQVFYFDAPHHEIKKLCEDILVNTLLYDYEIDYVSE